ncbi:Six-hairpin glycosidase-like protein [Kalaharituber pfeilii]|nr:Six-hairpin glycosidase-like protein [Kalaharituber pfeilii]
MHYLRRLLLVALALPQAFIVTADVQLQPVEEIEKRQINVNSWIQSQTPVSWTGLYRNIGNTGQFATNTDAGSVIASPSTSSPDYFYQWVRDSALVFKVVLNQFINGDTSVESHIRNYVTESNKLQHTNNPSGDYYTGGIGEPKFHVNGAAYDAGWGRPQHDGPALRAIVLSEYANILLDRGDISYVKDNLYKAVLPYDTVIKADLEHVSHKWQENNFDLWEEVSARHFFTHIVQRRALFAGAELADRLNDTGAATWYRQQADAIGTYLPNFWSSSKNHIVAMLDANNGRSGIDCGNLLGAIHGNGKRGWGLYSPESDEVLATLDALINVFQPMYPINNNGMPGIAVGRYPEDVYDGAGTSIANPWFICTFTTAEILYTAVQKYRDDGKLTVGTKSISWFRRFLPNAVAGTVYQSTDPNFTTIVNGFLQFADNQMARGAYHTTSDGSISEQFSRYDGFQKGARDLTWSYASFLTAAWAREGEVAF